MGVDIDLFAERRTPSGRWEYVPCPGTAKVYRSAPFPGEQVVDGYVQFPGDGWSAMETWYDVRDYGLFERLANVRNFDDVEPLAPLRGWPEDASPQVAAAREQTDYGRTWYVVRELLDALQGRHPAFLACLEEITAAAGAPPEDVRVVIGFT